MCLPAITSRMDCKCGVPSTFFRSFAKASIAKLAFFFFLEQLLLALFKDARNDELELMLVGEDAADCGHGVVETGGGGVSRGATFGAETHMHSREPLTLSGRTM